jgi:hypothetical protein
MGATGERTGLGGLGLLAGFGLVGLDGLAVQDLTEQDATDEGFALLALETKLVRPGAIGERLVVEEVLRLLGVRQGLPLRRLLRLLRLRRRCLRLGLLDRLAGLADGLDEEVPGELAQTLLLGIHLLRVGLGIRLDGGDDGRDLAALCVPDWTLLRRVASSRAFLILSRSRAYERPTRIE